MTGRFLIVGQGIAGTVLSWVLRRAGAEVTLADAGFSDAASLAAAGIVNPVTGKNYVKSWRIDELLPAAKAVYQALENELGVAIWQERRIFRLFSSVQERNNWDARAGMPDYEGYIGDEPAPLEWLPLLQPGFSFGSVRQGGRVDFAGLLTAYREFARKHHFLWETHINPLALPDGYDAVVFCEGYRAAQNPLFAHLPWQLNKGEALLLRFPALSPPYPETMLKKNILLAHLGDGLYWAGSPYLNTFSDTRPTPEGRRFVLEGLKEVFAAKVEVEDHVAAIRPAVAGRRPFIGRLPGRPQCVLFNGWGAKGASLAPFWAQQLAKHLLHGEPLDKEVDIARFHP